MSAAVATSFSASSLPNLALKRWATFATFLCADLAGLTFAATLAVFARSIGSPDFRPSEYLPFAGTVVLFLAVYGAAGLYPGIAANPIQEFRRILNATSLAYLIIISATFLIKNSTSFSRLVFFCAWGLSVLSVLLARGFVRFWFSRKPWWGIPVVILGSGRRAQALLTSLLRQPCLGLRPVAVLDRSVSGFPYGCSDLDAEDLEGITLGSLSRAPEFANAYPACYAIVAMPDESCEGLDEVLCDYAGNFSHVLVIPNLFPLCTLWVSAKEVGGMLGLEVCQTLTRSAPLLVKRCLDLTLAAVGSILLLPLMALLYAAVRLTSQGPGFYGQRRVGRDGQPFTAWKFRTMVLNADEVLEQYLESNPELWDEWERDRKLKHDPRVTRVGHILRKISLDELPQIWNVLRAEMSLVGPRPIVSAEKDKYGKRFDLYCKVPPGITGLWQVSGRNNTTYEERTQLDEYYVRNWSVIMDLYILCRTVKTVLFTEGAY